MDKEKAKKVITYNLNNTENGYLVELQKTDRFTNCYLTTIKPASFKGYHLHRVRESNYVCIKGKVKILLYTKDGMKEVVLNSDPPEKLNIPINIPTGLSNIWDEEAWLVNFPNPAYDPDLKDEQVDYSEDDLTPDLFDSL